MKLPLSLSAQAPPPASMPRRWLLRPAWSCCRSGGQRRRVAIARTAASKAPLVLLDEPTASLDPRSAAAVIDAIRTATTNRTVLVVTHDRDLAAIAERVVTNRSTQLQQTEGR